MSPERKGKGEYRSIWERKELGRIKVRYGRTLADHRRALALLSELYDNDQLDVLRAFKRREVTMRELLAAKRLGRHRRNDVLVDLRIQQPLWKTLEKVGAVRGGEHHKAVRRSMLRTFARAAGGLLGAEAKVADLERLEWEKVRPSFRSPSHWNNMRTAIGASLSQLLGGPEHEFRRRLMKAIPVETERARDVDITVEQFWALVDRLPDLAKPGIVTLAVTAMRLETEYLRCAADDKRPLSHGVYCPGSKTADASGIIDVAPELWHWVDAAIPAPLQKKALRDWFHEAAVAIGLGRYEPTGKTKRVVERRLRSGPPAKGERTGDKIIEVPATRYTGIRLHDLRHLALQLALDGGAQLNDVQSLARHADPAMTMRYLKRSGRKRAAEAIGRALGATKTEETA
jgi:integrase